jgi:hypothetical protein
LAARSGRSASTGRPVPRAAKSKTLLIQVKSALNFNYPTELGNP